MEIMKKIISLFCFLILTNTLDASENNNLNDDLNEKEIHHHFRIPENKQIDFKNADTTKLKSSLENILDNMNKMSFIEKIKNIRFKLDIESLLKDENYSQLDKWVNLATSVTGFNKKNYLLRLQILKDHGIYINEFEVDSMHQLWEKYIEMTIKESSMW